MFIFDMILQNLSSHYNHNALALFFLGLHNPNVKVGDFLRWGGCTSLCLGLSRDSSALTRACGVTVQFFFSNLILTKCQCSDTMRLLFWVSRRSSYFFFFVNLIYRVRRKVCFGDFFNVRANRPVDFL